MNILLIILILLLFYEGSNRLIIAIFVRLELLSMGCTCRVFLLNIHPNEEKEKNIIALYEKTPEEELPRLQQQLVEEAGERAMMRSHDNAFCNWYTSFFWLYHFWLANLRKN